MATRVALLLLLLAGCGDRSSADDSIAPDVAAPRWLLVDTANLELAVMDGDRERERFTGISLGRNGAGLKQRLGDDVTPIGSFRVRWISHHSRFDVFIGLDYPNRAYAERGLAAGLIDAETYAAIERALAAGELPPQDTPLGGYLGLHGIGGGSPEVHAEFNWTNGCIALTNPQIRRLAAMVRIGTRVEIR